MPINNLTTSNTFGQWLDTTNALVSKFNFVESANSDAQTANTNAQKANTDVQRANTDVQRANTLVQAANVIVQLANTNAQKANTDAQTANTNAWEAAATANTITISQTVQLAFNQANSANILAQAAFNQANSANVLAQAAFDKANLVAQNSFTTFVVAGQSNVIADSNNDTLTLVAGSNITITTDPNADSITISSTGGGGSGTASNVFAQIAVSGQDNIVATSNNTILNVVAGDNITLTTSNTTNTLTIAMSTAFGTGNVSGILSETATPSTITLRDVNADIYANNFLSSSDVRLKENIRPIENALELVKQLQGVKFNWKSTNAEQIGLIAQEVEKVLPWVVNGDDIRSVNYSVIVSVLIEAIKELSNRLDKLEK